MAQVAEIIALTGPHPVARWAYDALSHTYKMFLNIGEAKRSPFDAREPGTGSPAEITDDLKRLFDLGFRKIIVRYRGSNAADYRSAPQREESPQEFAGLIGKQPARDLRLRRRRRLRRHRHALHLRPLQRRRQPQLQHHAEHAAGLHLAAG